MLNENPHLARLRIVPCTINDDETKIIPSIGQSGCIPVAQDSISDRFVEALKESPFISSLDPEFKFVVPEIVNVSRPANLCHML